jgi:hypothetical protein
MKRFCRYIVVCFMCAHESSNVYSHVRRSVKRHRVWMTVQSSSFISVLLRPYHSNAPLSPDKTCYRVMELAKVLRTQVHMSSRSSLQNHRHFEHYLQSLCLPVLHDVSWSDIFYSQLSSFLFCWNKQFRGHPILESPIGWHTHLAYSLRPHFLYTKTSRTTLFYVVTVCHLVRWFWMSRLRWHIVTYPPRTFNSTLHRVTSYNVSQVTSVNTLQVTSVRVNVSICSNIVPFDKIEIPRQSILYSVDSMFLWSNNITGQVVCQRTSWSTW